MILQLLCIFFKYSKDDKTFDSLEEMVIKLQASEGCCPWKGLIDI